MKNRKFLSILLIFVTLMLFVTNVDAKACKKYSIEKCPAKCGTYKGKCMSKANAEKKTKSCQENCNAKNTGQSAITACLKTCSNTGATPGIKSPASNAEVKFCASTAKVWKIVGVVFTIFKILIPIILIITASIDLAHAVLNADDGLGKALKKVITRLILAIAIFLLPSLVTTIIGLFVGFSENGIAEDYEYCKSCILSPNKCDTSQDASTSTVK